MSNLIYDGPVTVYDKKTDGTPLLIGKGDRMGEPYYKLSFKVNGEYVNLMDFAGITEGRAGNYHVEYYQKFDPKTGQPELYNDRPQYQLESIMPMSSPQSPQNGASAPQQGGSSPAPVFGSDRDESIRSQTSLKVAGELYAAEIRAAGSGLDVPSGRYDAVRFAVIYKSVKDTLDFRSLEEDATENAVDEDQDDGDSIPF